MPNTHTHAKISKILKKEKKAQPTFEMRKTAFRHAEDQEQELYALLLVIYSF